MDRKRKLQFSKNSIHAPSDLADAVDDLSSDGESFLLGSGVLDHVHVVEPDVLHASHEVFPHLHALAGLQEVVNPAQVDLVVGWRSGKLSVV